VFSQEAGEAAKMIVVTPGMIEVEFTTGARLRICGPVDVPIVSVVM
jgi:hypothetical protein